MERLLEIIVEKGEHSKIEKMINGFKVKLKTGRDEELIEVLSKFFGIYKGRIKILGKTKGKRKKVRVKLY